MDRCTITTGVLHVGRMQKKNYVLSRKKMGGTKRRTPYTKGVFNDILWKMLLVGVQHDATITSRRRRAIAQGAILNWLDWARWTRLINRDLWGKMRFFLIFIVR